MDGLDDFMGKIKKEEKLKCDPCVFDVGGR